jgi:DnaK suppressor protein
MNEEDQKHLKNLMEQQLADLVSRAKLTMADLLENAADDIGDFLDLATSESSRSHLLRIRDRENKLIKKIRQALHDMAEGNYGYCLECDEEISIERLKARPVARFCIHCKTKLEAKEKFRNLGLKSTRNAYLN